MIKIYVWTSDTTSRSYFGKMNLTLGSVVPLATFSLRKQLHWCMCLQLFANHYQRLVKISMLSKGHLIGDGWRLQNGWIFGKVPVHFQSKHLYCRFLPFPSIDPSKIIIKSAELRCGLSEKLAWMKKWLTEKVRKRAEKKVRKWAEKKSDRQWQTTKFQKSCLYLYIQLYF